MTLDAHTDLVCRQWFGSRASKSPRSSATEEASGSRPHAGAFRGDAAGCGWVTDPRFEDSALTSVQASPREGVLASGVSTGPLDGAFALTDNGDLRVERASESDRFVISATEATDGARYALLVSLDPSTNRPVYELERLRDDTTTPLGVLPLEEDDFRIVLVGSTERGDALLEVTRYEDSGRPDALLQVDTAGEQRVLGELEGPVAALADDAGTWIGSEDGLWRLERGGLVLASDAFPVRALARVNGALAGSAYPDGPLLARWLGDGAWERAARFDSVRGIAPCEQPEDLAERCAEEWEDWQRDVVPLEEDEQDALSERRRPNGRRRHRRDAHARRRMQRRGDTPERSTHSRSGRWASSLCAGPGAAPPSGRLDAPPGDDGARSARGLQARRRARHRERGHERDARRGGRDRRLLRRGPAARPRAAGEPHARVDHRPRGRGPRHRHGERGALAAIVRTLPRRHRRDAPL